MPGAADVAQALPGAKFPAVTPSAATTAVEVRVRYSETDRMGVAYHAHYLQWAELGRTEHMRRHGVRYRALEERGHLLAVSEAGLRIVRSARYDDLLRLRTTVVRLGPAKIEHEYRLFRQEELLAVGNVTLAVIDREGKVQRVPEYFQTEE